MPKKTLEEIPGAVRKLRFFLEKSLKEFLKPTGEISAKKSGKESLKESVKSFSKGLLEKFVKASKGIFGEISEEHVRRILIKFLEGISGVISRRIR